MSHAHKTDKHIPLKEEAPASTGFPIQVKARVAAYWRRLGLSDPALIEHLADECLFRARKRMGRGSDVELLMRALEEAQRRFDHALARALHLPPGDAHTIAAARAAVLLGGEWFHGDNLFRAGDPSPEFQGQLQAILPRSTPPEAHLAMAETPLDFWLFKSTQPH